MMFHWINFLILTTALVWLGRKKLNAYFSQKRDELKMDIELSQSKYNQIKLEYDLVLKQVGQIEQELKSLKAAAIEEIDSEGKRIRLETTQTISRLEKDSEARLRSEKEKIVATLETELLDLAIEKAQSSLRAAAQQSNQEWIQTIAQRPFDNQQGRKNYASK